MASSTPEKQRLVDALQLVSTAMTSPNAFENCKESTFSALRRGCLDLRKSVDQLDSEEFTPELIEYAWLFLMELSKAKLRRKHALECINIMLLSPRWGSILRNTDRVQAKVATLTTDMQIAFGYTSPLSVAPVRTTANIPTTALVRKSSLLPAAPLVRAKSFKRAASMKQVPDVPVHEEPIVVEPVLFPAPSSSVDTNPFRMDFNPFKDSRVKTRFRSNPHAFRSSPTAWWEPSVASAPQPSWWD